MISLIQGLLIIPVLLTSIPVGFLLSKITSEELSFGKRYFKSIILSCLFLIVLSFDLTAFKIISFNVALIVVLVSIYLLIIAFISLKKAKDI